MKVRFDRLRKEMKHEKRENERQLAMLASGVESVKKSQIELKTTMKEKFDKLNKNVDASKMEVKKATQEHHRNLTNAIGKFETGVKNLTNSRAELEKKMKGMLKQLKNDIADHELRMRNATARCWIWKKRNNTQQVIQLKKYIQKMSAELCDKNIG